MTLENVFALTDSKLWAIHFKDFQYLFEKNIELAEWGRLWMAEEITKLKIRSVEMITNDDSSRYWNLLKTKPEILQFDPLKHNASILVVKVISLSRYRKNLYILIYSMYID